MKNYMAVYLGSPDLGKKIREDASEGSKERMKEGMMQWGKWMEDNKENIVYAGAPLGVTKRVDKNGISDTRNAIGAFVVVKAESHDDAAKMFLNHPHFMIFPGECVEIMEELPLPRM